MPARFFRLRTASLSRKLAFLLLGVLLSSLVLTACGETPTATGTSATTAANRTTAANAPGTTVAATGTTAAVSGNAAVKLNKDISGNVEFWHIWASPVRRNAIRRVVAVCQAQLPNIKVKETYKPFGDIWTANTAAVAAGSGMPDVIVEDRPKLALAAANNIQSSLQKYIQKDGFDTTAFWPVTWQQTLYNNESYGVPFETDVRVLFYSKNAFREAGLDPEKPPTTWSQLEEYADKLDKKKDDGTYERWGFSPFVGGNWDLWSYNNGAPIVQDGKPTVNDPKVVEAVQWMKKWSERYGGYSAVQKFRGTFQAAPQDAFMSGKVAMFVDINGYASGLNFFRPQYTTKDNKRENLDWGVSYLPYNNSQSKPTSFSGGFALSIPRGAKNGDAAWEFIKCATGPEAQLSWARDTYSMPVRPAVANDPQLTADPQWQFMVKAMDFIAPPGLVKEYSNYGEQIDKRLTEVWEGKTEAKAALDQAQQAIDAEIAKNKK